MNHQQIRHGTTKHFGVDESPLRVAVSRSKKNRGDLRRYSRVVPHQVGSHLSLHFDHDECRSGIGLARADKGIALSDMDREISGGLK